MSRGEGELLTVPKPRAVSLLSVYLAVKPVGEPDAGDRHVRFDERGWETERCRMAQAIAPILDSTRCQKLQESQEACSGHQQSAESFDALKRRMGTLAICCPTTRAQRNFLIQTFKQPKQRVARME